MYPFVGFPGDSALKTLPANAGDIGYFGWSLVREDPLKQGMATHSNIPA